MENKKKEILTSNKVNSVISITLSLAIFFYFIYGFYTDENSAGAGGFKGDFESIWSNLLIIKEDLLFKNDAFLRLDNPYYNDSRTPLSYILHIYLNPLTDNKENFRLSVFIISLLLPVLMFVAIKQNYKNINNHLVLLLALIITLSPYFRTSAYWALGENYGLIALVGSYILLSKTKDQYGSNSDKKNFFLISILCFASSICVYFDQKLIFVPLYVLIKILNLKIHLKFKYVTILSFIIFGAPYLYLIFLWGSIIPPNAADSRQTGNIFNFYNFGYCITIIAFYVMPFLFLKNITLKKLKGKLFNNKFYIILIFILLYGLIIFTGQDFQVMPNSGKGLFHKIFLLVENTHLRLFLTLFSFLLGAVFIKIVIDKKNDEILIYYFLLISIFIIPFYQEYLDPLIYILLFTFFNTKLNIKFSNVFLLVIYFTIFLFSSQLYYSLIL